MFEAILDKKLSADRGFIKPKRKPREEVERLKRENFERAAPGLENPDEVKQMLGLADGGRIGFKKAGVVKPYGMSQAVVDKIDLDDVKRLRSKGFTVEKIANKYKISKGAMERIINANKNYFTKLTPRDKLSNERLKALNKATKDLVPGKTWADITSDHPSYRIIIDAADRITGTGQKGASGISYKEYLKNVKNLKTKKADFEAAEKWILKNAKKYNDPVEMRKGFIKDLGSKNSFLTSSGTASEFFSENFVNELLGGKEIKFEKGKTKSIVNNIFGSAIYNFNPKVRKQIVDALTDFAKKPMDTRYEARQFFKKPLFKKFGINKQINGPISRLIFADLGEKIYERVKQFRVPRMDTIKHIRYLSEVVGPKYKKEFLIAADAMEDAQQNLWSKAKQKLNIADNINFEHKIPQSFIDDGYADKIEYIKVTPTPRKFNEAKFRNFDSPMRRLMNAYEKTSNINEKKKIFSKMEDLKYDFSSKTGGYLDSVSITDKDGKIRFSSTDEVISNPNQLRSLLEKNIKDVSNFAKSKGFTLNSFAGVVDLSQSGITIPANVRRSMDNVLKVGGKIARAGGKAAVVVDPIFAAMDFSKAMGEGVSGKQATAYTGQKFVQDLLNLPRTLEDVAYLATDKGTLKNFGEKENRLFSYQPRTFADKYLEKTIESTPQETLDYRKAVIDFDQRMPTFTDDIDIPRTQEDIEREREEFFKQRGVTKPVKPDFTSEGIMGIVAPKGVFKT